MRPFLLTVIIKNVVPDQYPQRFVNRSRASEAPDRGQFPPITGPIFLAESRTAFVSGLRFRCASLQSKPCISYRQ